MENCKYHWTNMKGTPFPILKNLNKFYNTFELLKHVLIMEVQLLTAK